MDKVSPPDALIRKFDLQELDEEEETERHFSAESDSDRNKRVLSNPKEYLINSYRYFYNNSLKNGQGGQYIYKLCLSESSVHKKRGKQGKASSILVVFPDMLSQAEADLHFHIAQTHHRETLRSSSDHTLIVRKVVEASWRTKQDMLSTVESSVNDQLKGLLSCVKQHMGEKGSELVAQLAEEGGGCAGPGG